MSRQTGLLSLKDKSHLIPHQSATNLKNKIDKKRYSTVDRIETTVEKFQSIQSNLDQKMTERRRYRVCLKLFQRLISS